MEGWDKKKIIIAATLVIVLVAIIAIFILMGGLGERGVVVEFDSNTSWAGSITDDSGYEIVSGQGKKSYSVSDHGTITVAGALADFTSPGSLTVRIIVNGNVVAEKTTTTPMFPIVVSAEVEGTL